MTGSQQVLVGLPRLTREDLMEIAPIPAQGLGMGVFGISGPGHPRVRLDLHEIWIG